MQLFYSSDIDSKQDEFTFDKNESRHIINVLRKSEGDKIFITNGQGYLFESTIISSDSKKCVIEINNLKKMPKRPYKLDMAVALTKMNDRYEWFLEKATEIGVDSITPLLCKNNERNRFKKDRYQKILQTALKQSNQFYIPELKESMSFSEYIEQVQSEYKFIAHCEDSKKQLLKNNLRPETQIAIMIGPEGDFTSEEINFAQRKGFVPVSLGNTRLRTETAAIVACHSVAFINES